MIERLRFPVLACGKNWECDQLLKDNGKKRIPSKKLTLEYFIHVLDSNADEIFYVV